MNPSDQLRTLLAQGRSRDEALADLKRSGASAMSCISALVEVEQLGIVEAKRALSESPSWSEYVRQNDQSLVDELKTLKFD